MRPGATRCAILSGVTRPGSATRGAGAGTGSAARGGRPGPQAGRARGGHGRRGARGADPADRFAPPYRIVTLRTPDGPLRARLDPREPAGRPLTFAGRSYRPAPGPLRRFVRTWGWRAYALPVLTLLTVLCGMDVANGSTGLPLVGTGSDAPAPQAAGTGAGGAAPAASSPAAPGPAKPTPTGIYVDDGGTGT